MRPIPARNIVSNKKEMVWRQSPTGRLALLAWEFRRGHIIAEDHTPEEREQVTVWLLNHPRQRSQVSA